MSYRLILSFLVGLITVAMPLQAQDDSFVSNVSKVGTTAGEFLKLGVGARGQAMGGAFTAVADDVTSIYYNPAGLAIMGRSGMTFDYTRWLADMDFGFVGVAADLGSAGTVGVSLTYFSAIDDMAITTVDDPDGNGEVFGANSFAVSVAYARQLTDRFSIGFNPKYIRENIATMGATGLAIDLGILYRTPFDDITLGMAIRNFGTDMQLDGDETLTLYDPDPTTSGNNGRIPADQRTDSWALPLAFNVGLSYAAIETSMHHLTVAAEAVVPNNNYQSLNFGAEYIFYNTLSLQAGYRSLLLDTVEESYTLGVGLRQALVGGTAIQAGFAYTSFGRLENTKKISLSVDF